jgi:peptidoglycan/xylan/chitin deacetylase (PgdA/CDA1 family)
MSTLKKLKQATLRSLKAVGAFRVAQGSGWRRRRLLILAYHGVSLEDEHLWDGSMYLRPDFFRSRMRMLQKSGATVLPLGEALERLYAGELPERSVALTFDDGAYDFAARAFPIIEEFGFPVTLYLTTFYSGFNRPVFDGFSSYLLWKARGSRLDLKALTGEPREFDLSSDAARREAHGALRSFARERGLSAEGKDELLVSLAKRLKVDHEELISKRLLHILKPSEVRALADAGVDVQLHTHRHRTPLDRELFRREMEDNRAAIREMTGRETTHFCYPSGVYHEEFLPWLEELGVSSATTCDTGYASRESGRLLLPRLLDVSSLSPIEFEGWLTGLSAALPRRREAGGREASAYGADVARAGAGKA